MTATAVVTGIGVMAPNGLGAADFWAATRAGRTGIGRITRFDPEQYPARLAGEVPGFEPREHIPSRLLPQTDHMTRLALTATEWALTDAGADPREWGEFDMGVVTASSSGGFEFGHRELEKLWSKGPRHVSAYQSFAWFYAVNSGQISIKHGMRGPSGVLVSDQAGGLDAIAQARRQVRKGIGLMVTGGIDSSLCPWGWVAHVAGGRLSSSDDPSRAFLPFDVSAAGHVAGEGGAILIVEDGAAARARGAGQVYGEIAGYAATFDPRPGAGREPGLRRAIELALSDAGIPPGEVDVVFGRAGVPVTVPKTMTGRLFSGGAALDIATALLSLRDGVIPPTTNVSSLAPGCDLDLVLGQARPAQLNTAVVLARGRGGFNAVMVVRAAG